MLSKPGTPSFLSAGGSGTNRNNRPFTTDWRGTNHTTRRKSELQKYNNFQ
jgi:hypothetical protein